MKIAHSVVVTPHLAGIYETSRDFVVALRKLNCDSRIVDPITQSRGEERGVPLEDWSFAEEADVIVSHSGLGEAFANTQKPVIHILHGRPRSTFLLEQSGELAVLSYIKKIQSDSRFKAFVTLWPEYEYYWSAFVPPEKLRVIRAPVNLDEWSPDGPRGYKFNGHRATTNIVISDVWRGDIDPFNVIMAYKLFAKDRPEVKLHIYAEPQRGTGWPIVKETIANRLGETAGFIIGLDNVYRAADALITPHKIATRTVREALACGCTVVMGSGQDYTPFVADPDNIADFAKQIQLAILNGDRRANRASAVRNFDSGKSALEFLEMMSKVIQ